MTDIELWQEILKNNDAAWRKLINKYEPLVYTVATRAGLSYAEAADCFQQTWTNLYRNRKSVKEPSRLSAWLITTSKREAIRILKRRMTTVEDAQLARNVDLAELPDEAVESLQLRNAVQFGLKQIDGRCQNMLKMLFFAPEDLSYAEIANKLGISANALGPARKRCLERLRKALDKDGLLDALI